MIFIVKLCKHAKFNICTEIISQCQVIIIPKQNDYVGIFEFILCYTKLLFYRVQTKWQMFKFTNKMHFINKQLMPYYKTLSKNVN